MQGEVILPNCRLNSTKKLQEHFEARSVLGRPVDIFLRHPLVLSLTKGKRKMSDTLNVTGINDAECDHQTTIGK